MKCPSLLLVQTLAIVSLLSTSYLVATDPCRKKLLGRPFVIVVLIAAAALLLRLPFRSPRFYGLEYEDSYVYVSAARLIALHGHVPPDPPLSAYLVTGCAMGSLEACQERTAFSGHYLGYPALLAMIVSLIGYTHDIGYYLALAANVLSIVLLYLLVARTNSCRIVGILGAAVLGLIPAFVVYGTSSLSESFSAFLVMASLYVYCQIRDLDIRNNKMRSVIVLAALTATLLYAVLIKRENLVLPLAFMFESVTLLFQSREGRRNTILQTVGSVLACGVVLILAIWKLGILQTVHSEAHEFGSFPFSLSHAVRLLPLLLAALGKWDWFLGAWIPLLLALTIDLRKNHHLLRTTLVALVGYLALYMTHVRGFYFLQGHVSALEWLRYLCNLSGLISIAVAFGAVQAWTLVRRVISISLPKTIMQGAGLLTLGGIVALSAAHSSILRAELAGEEQTYRILPALRSEKIALAACCSQPYIITYEPLILEMFGGAKTKFVEIGAVTDDLLNRLHQGGFSQVIFLDQTIYRTDENRQRFAKQLDVLHNLKRRSVYKDDNCEIIILDLISSPAGKQPARCGDPTIKQERAASWPPASSTSGRYRCCASARHGLLSDEIGWMRVL
jgi:hypothetical protein